MNIKFEEHFYRHALFFLHQRLPILVPQLLNSLNMFGRKKDNFLGAQIKKFPSWNLSMLDLQNLEDEHTLEMLNDEILRPYFERNQELSFYKLSWHLERGFG